MSKKRNSAEKTPQRSGQVLHEVWGVVFVALGLLVLIALLSHFAGPAENILGPLGRYLSVGLVRLFGSVASLMFPAAVVFAGFRLFRGSALYYRTFLWGGVVVIEVCVLMAIRNLPVVQSEAFSLSPNLVGHAVTYFLYYPFRAHRFGPYFIFSFGLLLTVAAAADINIRLALVVIWRSVRAASVWLWAHAVSAYTRFFGKKEPSPAAADGQATEAALEAAALSASRSRRKGPSVRDVLEADAGGLAQPGAVLDESEEEARRLLEEQLKEFRAKKQEPLKITTDAQLLEQEAEKEEEESKRKAKKRRGQEKKGEEEDADEREGKELDAGEEEGGEETREEQEGGEDEGAQEEWSEDLSGDEQYVEEKEDEDYYKVPTEEDESFRPAKEVKPYVIPPVDIIPDPPSISSQYDRVAIEVNSHTLERTLANFGIEGKVVNVSPGPVVSRYEIELAPGIKISKVVSLQDDLAMAVGGKKIRIEAPIPGKAAVGIELPNEDMQLVYFKHILLSEAFTKSKAKLPIIIGRNIAGSPLVADISKMPHLLIAGQTGSGKSVCINALICSLLFTKKPDELRLIMVDPKKVELSYFQGIPHLMSPVVTESKEAVRALQWAVMEMTRRYKVLARAGARNIDSFNKKIAEHSVREGALPHDDNKPLPFIVIIVDELADLMLTARGDVEALIQRIAQLARAVGIHLIVATQRPSVDIITGPIKANLTSRIAFRTIQAVDSRTILGHQGAEKLLGRGDMLFLRSGAPDIERYHGAFISEEDVERVVTTIRAQEVEMDQIESFEKATGETSFEEGGGGGEDSGERDEYFAEAARAIVSVGQGSTSFLQRRFKLGYARAGRLMDQLEKAGVVGPQEGSKAREVLVGPDELEEILRELGY